jgi:hypothetical protein
MAQAAIRLTDIAARRDAVSWVWGSEPETIVRFETPGKRTAKQNAAMWAMLTDIAEQVSWGNQQLTPDDWKLLFLADMDRGSRMAPALDGRGWVNLNTSSSALKVAEFEQLLDAIHKFAAAHGVMFRAGF